ncbi:DNA transfer protein GP20 [Escherichia coli]|uniref:phage DNA ejection protein n=1 Tax=Escherichia coli TaxID=562 RepID=UPI000DFB2DAF|nr:phage DNA ejection protein [Escherichia coli]STN56367.1 DNA transfer protein GP20 [Escherichia coli]
MATWQGTNGGLLAGIGGVNSNAPSVNDIGNTLQLIRQNNDIERSGANNVGLTALQGLSGIAGVFQQEKQAQRQKEFQQAYESEPFRNAMLRMANTPRGSTAFEKAMQQAQKAINALTQGAKSDALSE